jgi:hypothetical protein
VARTVVNVPLQPRHASFIGGGGRSSAGSDVGGDAAGLVAGEQVSRSAVGAAEAALCNPRSGLPKSAAPPIMIVGPIVHGPDVDARRCLKCLVGDFVKDIFVGLVEFVSEVGAAIHGDYSSSVANAAAAPAPW